MSLACSKIIWLRGSLAELDFSETDPTPLHADNTSAIQITANPVYHERTKHIEVDCYSIREAFEARVITLPHISTDLQIDDIFTKALPRHLHLAVVHWIIRYVQGTSTRGLFFPAGNSTRLAAYSDAHWAGCADTRRSITGWCVFLGDALISWKSKNQD